MDTMDRYKIQGSIKDVIAILDSAPIHTDLGEPMPMNNPPHPGEIVRSECLEPLGLTVTRAAQGLGVTRQALSDLVNEKAGVSVEMAIRLSQAFGSTPETWLGMQTAYELWQARGRAERIEVERFTAASST